MGIRSMGHKGLKYEYSTFRSRGEQYTKIDFAALNANTTIARERRRRNKRRLQTKESQDNRKPHKEKETCSAYMRSMSESVSTLIAYGNQKISPFPHRPQDCARARALGPLTRRIRQACRTCSRLATCSFPFRVVSLPTSRAQECRLTSTAPLTVLGLLHSRARSRAREQLARPRINALRRMREADLRFTDGDLHFRGNERNNGRRWRDSGGSGSEQHESERGRLSDVCAVGVGRRRRRDRYVAVLRLPFLTGFGGWRGRVLAAITLASRGDDSGGATRGLACGRRRGARLTDARRALELHDGGAATLSSGGGNASRPALRKRRGGSGGRWSGARLRGALCRSVRRRRRAVASCSFPFPFPLLLALGRGARLAVRPLAGGRG